MLQQINRVATRSPLANIFMVELEECLIPTMGDMVDLLLKYVNDMFTFIKNGEVDRALHILISFHIGNKFTFEKESNNSYCVSRRRKRMDYSTRTYIGNVRHKRLHRFIL